MSFFDLLFPEWATATHLRTLTEQNRNQKISARITNNRAERLRKSAQRKTSERISELESELNQAALVIEALIETLEANDIASKDEIQSMVLEIDARDGVVDGQITPEENGQFMPNRKWEETEKPKFNFPEE